MDASQFIQGKVDEKGHLTPEADKARRVKLAEDLRDLADQIEEGHRVVQEMSTLEAVTNQGYPQSVLILRSSLKSQ